MKHEDCPECQAGLMRAAMTPIGWTCSEHGRDELLVYHMLSGIALLREQLAAANKREQSLHRVWDALGAGWAYADHRPSCVSLLSPYPACDCGYAEMEANVERVLNVALAALETPDG